MNAPAVNPSALIPAALTPATAGTGTMMTLQQAAVVLGAAACAQDTAFSRVTTDSRTIHAGDLFVALSGERFDGHDFARAALEQGAAGVLVSRDLGLPGQIMVPDTRAGLAQLAQHWRAQFTLPLIAVTGSNGKTTVKQMIASILAAHVLGAAGGTGAAAGDAAFATAGNLNNEIGVPLTLLRLRAQHAIGVVELGMNHPGEIALLAGITRPTVALVNNAQREHQEFMKSVADVAAENGSVFDHLSADGTAVINADDEFAGFWRQLARRSNAQRRIIDFGVRIAADVSANYHLALYGSDLELMTPVGNAEVILRIPGAHNVLNACAAAACAVAAGVRIKAIEAGLNAFVPYRGRLQKKVAASGAVVIDDSYNANPDSVRAAIDVLANLAGRRMLVLGRMAEVGDQGAQFHHEVGSYARERGIDVLLGFGPETAPAIAGFGAGGMRFDDIDVIKAKAGEFAVAGATLLIKGSRSARMERVVAALTGETAGGEH